MTNLERTRIVKGLASAGWTEEQINIFILYLKTGDEEYKPSNENKK